jgi:hypothetical protein
VGTRALGFSRSSQFLFALRCFKKLNLVFTSCWNGTIIADDSVGQYRSLLALYCIEAYRHQG